MRNDEKSIPVLEFNSHAGEVNQVLPSSTLSSQFFSWFLRRLVIRSCSVDKTVKVFDINSAAAVATYADHE